MLYFSNATLAQQERVIFILPEDQPPTYCTEEENCYHLTELINHNLLSGQTSNTTIALLPGTHTCTSAVNKTLSISNATNFALIAANSSEGATIKCNGSIGFKFSFITNLIITGEATIVVQVIYTLLSIKHCALIGHAYGQLVYV